MVTLIRNCSALVIVYDIIMDPFFHYPNIVANLSSKMSCVEHYGNIVAVYKLDYYGLVCEKSFGEHFLKISLWPLSLICTKPQDVLTLKSPQ